MVQKVFIIAGEASGDQLGAGLIRALKEKYPSLEIRGICGAAMKDAGLAESLFPMEELSVMGLAEVLPRIPKFMNLIAKTVQAIRVFNPDVVVTIDSPDFSFRVQEKLKSLNVRAKKIHYVAPTVWAWRAGRAAKIARFLDGIICLFPFEPLYFEREGLRAVAVGHPMVTSGLMEGDGAAFRTRHNIAEEQKVLGLFCGSRTAEVKGILPLMIETAKRIKNTYPDMVCVVPTLQKWKNELEMAFSDSGLTAIITDDASEKWDAFHAPDAALAVSGTVALEIALVGIPHAIVYKMNKWTWEIVSRIIKIKFAHLGNVLLQKLVYPEFIQDKATADAITPVLEELFKNESARQEQSESSYALRQLLEPNPNEKAADSAAAFVGGFFPLTLLDSDIVTRRGPSI